MKKLLSHLKLFAAAVCLLAAAGSAQAQCNAGFGYTVNANGNVTFTNTSTGAIPPTFYSWNFGDGSTSPAINPSHTYTANGSYTVVLSMNSSSTSCTSTLSQVVWVNTACTTYTPGFTFTVGANGLVNFTDASVGTSTNTMWYWDFGDGNYDYVPNPSNVYATNGVFLVTLTVYDSLCTSSISQTLSVSNVTCNLAASFSLTQSGAYANFTSTSTGTNSATSYTWDYGDGNVVTGGSTATHIYANGVYTVTLYAANPVTVTCTDIAVQTITVSTTCSLSPSFTYSYNPTGNVSFTSTSTGTTSSTIVSWDFGDGTYGTGQTVSNSYSFNGNYTVTMMLSDTVSGFCYDSISQVINVTNLPCTANSNFSLWKDSSMAYTWDAYCPYQPNVVGATWSWGDGTSTTALYPSHTYSAAGWYNICLTVSVACGAAGTSSTTCINSNIFKTTSQMAMITVNVLSSPMGIKSITTPLDPRLIVSPNPNNGHFKVSLGFADDKAEVSVYNLLGETVYKTRMENDTKELNLEDLPNGSYFIKAFAGGKAYTSKIVVNR